MLDFKETEMAAQVFGLKIQRISLVARREDRRAWLPISGRAKQIGLTIPPNVLARADRVIK